MAWSVPRTWVTAELVLASHMNAHVRDNLLETGPAKVTALGDLIYATAANALTRLARGTARQGLQVNAAENALEWAASPQSVLTTAGDILYASAANTLARLGIGTAGQVLKTNAGATAPEWESPASAETANTLVRRDASGRARFADPDNALDAANKGWTENLITAAMVTVHDRVVATAGPVNSDAETTLYSKSITANLLGADGGLRLSLRGDRYCNISPGTYTVRVKFGATTIHTFTVTTNNVAARYGWQLDVLLQNTAADAQRVSAGLQTHTTTSGTLAVYAALLYGTAAEDTTGAKDLVITAQCSSASADLDWIVRHGILELIGPTS